MSLLIATPMFGGVCEGAYHRSCMELQRELLAAGVPHDFWNLRNESLITRGRDTAAAAFLASEYEALLFIDADIEFAPDDVGKLWNLGQPLAVAAYAMKRLDAPLSAWEGGKLVTLEGRTEPFPVDFAGTGFMMIRRALLADLRDRHPEWHYRDGDPPTDRWGFFQDPIVDGVKLSEDYFFCLKAREAGYQVWCEPTIRLTHWGKHGYTGE